jgi:N12 class adenine-specific DNA methylase
MVTGSELTNYKDLVEELVNKYPVGYLEVAHVQYYDDVMKTFPEVVTDQELMSMFKKHSKTKVLDMFISYCDPSEPFRPFH